MMEPSCSLEVIAISVSDLTGADALTLGQWRGRGDLSHHRFRLLIHAGPGSRAVKQNRPRQDDPRLF